MFVPLTLGLSWILVICESVYVMTGQQIYKDMTRFWGKLFGINFAMGITTGITLEFQFGTNWAYYSHYVGDIFGVPLAIEGMMAFFFWKAPLSGCFFSLAGTGCRASSICWSHFWWRWVPIYRPMDTDRQRLDAEPGGR